MIDRLFGMSVMASPFLEPPPKLHFNWSRVNRLDLDLGDEPPKVREFNDWLKKRFGTAPEQSYIIGSGSSAIAVVSPSMLARIRSL